MRQKRQISPAPYWFFLIFIYAKLALSEELITDELDIKKQPVAMPVGPLEFYPLLEIGEFYNDNIFQHNRARKGSFVNQIHAGGVLAYEKNFNKYNLVYALQSTLFHDSPQDDYIDHYIGADTHTEFTSRNRFDFNIKYLNSHYQRGVFLGRDITNPSTGSTEPDQYHVYSAGGGYRYGHLNGKGNLELQFNIEDYTFDNNLNLNVSQDRTQYGVTPGFYFRLYPNTYLMTQVENRWTRHKENSFSIYDNNKQRFLVGANWFFSRQTNALARVGYLRQEFENGNFQGLGGVTWDMSVKWSPLSYSQLDFSLSRDSSVNIGNNNIRSFDRFRLGWTHNWTSYISTQLTGAIESADNLTIGRQDDFKSFGIDLNYGVKRWLGFGVNYNYRGLQSGNQTLDFDQNTILFYVTGNPRISDEMRTPWASWY